MPFCYFRASFIEIYRSLTCGLIFNFNNKILNKLNFTSIIPIPSLWYIVFKLMIFTRNITWALHSYLLSILIIPWNPPHQLFQTSIFIDPTGIFLPFCKPTFPSNEKESQAGQIYDSSMELGCGQGTIGTSNFDVKLLDHGWQIV